MLSINGGTSRICIPCFEEEKGDLEVFDDHEHAPYSPNNMVPYHPFTLRSAQSRLFEDDSASEYVYEEESAEDVPGWIPKGLTGIPPAHRHQATTPGSRDHAGHLLTILDKSGTDIASQMTG